MRKSQRSFGELTTFIRSSDSNMAQFKAKRGTEMNSRHSDS